MNEINIIDFKFNIEQGVFSLVLNCWLLIAAIILFYIVRFFIKKFLKSEKVNNQIKSVKLKYSFGGQEIEYEITKNYQNIEIAHKIYIELITRKTALPIDENNDIIIEVYDSWYELFKITREELKNLSGELLLNNSVSNDLIRLLTDILNKGLRPHLTIYHSKYRKWYNDSLSCSENKNLSPQQIQVKYEKYNELITSMKLVNQLLIEYAKQLNEIARGDNLMNPILVSKTIIEV